MQIQNSKCKMQNYCSFLPKTFKFLLVLFTFYFLLLTFPVYAHGAGSGRFIITPASPLYFLTSIREILELKFAKATSDRADRELEFANRRISEVNSLTNTPREDLIGPTLERYWAGLSELKGIIGLKDEDTAARITDLATRHMNDLQTAYGQVSDPGARRSIRAAIFRLSGWDQALIDKFILLKLPVPEGVKAGKLKGCGFLSQAAGSSALNSVERVTLQVRVTECYGSF